MELLFKFNDSISCFKLLISFCFLASNSFNILLIFCSSFSFLFLYFAFKDSYFCILSLISYFKLSKFFFNSISFCLLFSLKESKSFTFCKSKALFLSKYIFLSFKFVFSSKSSFIFNMEILYSSLSS